jgi:2-polyprenyl-3-methyl-5-hydroxy-6-metoxy-1,4-benzoquinol methylase
MVIWLASYPRSGNSFARIALKHLFGLRNTSRYKEKVTPESCYLIGKPLEMTLEEMAAAAEPCFVKTHEMPADDDYPAIYLVRDGRDALVSYAHFTLSTENGTPTGGDRAAFLRVLRELITSNSRFGGWGPNVLAWKQRTVPTVMIRHEDLVSSPGAVLQAALSAIGQRHLLNDGATLPTFQDLHKALPWFFRKGQIGAWRDEMPEALHDLFWERHQEAMVALDYPRDFFRAKTVAQTTNIFKAPASSSELTSVTPSIDEVSSTPNGELIAKLGGNACHTETMPAVLPAWALEMAWVSGEDERLPSAIDGGNLALNRMRLATFLARFADDKDVRDLLALDVLGTVAGLPLSSTGLEETIPSLTIRPFRLWEYTWLYKALQLSAGGLNVLDLGGPASHLSILAALAGCRVTSIDINPAFVQAAQECARALDLTSLEPRLGDMRDLSAFSDEHFDVVISCSVLEHLTAHDQEVALREVARVLKPGGLVGLTFDFGLGAPGANEHLPPPHDPPPNSAEALRRYMQGGLVQAGNPFADDPIPGSLFRHESIAYTVASLFLAKPPASILRTPQCERIGSRLDRLFIRGLPYRIHKHVSHLTELTGNLSGERKEPALAIMRPQTEVEMGDEALNHLRSQLERVKEQHTWAITLEQAAAERLTALHEKDRAIVQLHTELAARDAALTEQHQRAIILEEAAAERLAALHEKDRAIVQLHTELAARDAALTEQHQRAVILEEAAAERLAALHEKDRAIVQLHTELAARDAALTEQRQQAIALQRAAGEGGLNFFKRRFNRRAAGPR